MGDNEMHILEDLYTGNVRPGERSFRQNSQYSRALAQAVESGDALIKSLTEEQKKLFEEYMDAQREVNILTDCETFIYALKLGAKLMLDVLGNGEMREI